MKVARGNGDSYFFSLIFYDLVTLLKLTNNVYLRMTSPHILSVLICQVCHSGVGSRVTRIIECKF